MMMMIYKMALEATKQKREKENTNRYSNLLYNCLHLNLFMFLLVTN